MSYILRALEKAEKDKQRRGSPNIDRLITSAPPSREASPDSRRRWLPIVLVALVLSCGAAWWVAQGFSGAGDAPEANSMAGAEAPVSGSQQSGPEGTVAPAPDQPPTPVQGSLPLASTEMAAAQSPPSLAVEGALLFATEPSRSRAFIDGNSYRIGDEVRPGLVLEDIDATHLWLRRGEQSYSYPY